MKQEPWKQELYHHGILGMKWGQRNGPPYPLSPGRHSKSEQKAGWRNSLAKGRTIAKNGAKVTRIMADKVTRYDKVAKKRSEVGRTNKRLNPIEIGLLLSNTYLTNSAIKYGTAFIGGALAYKIADLTGREEIIDIGKKAAFGIMAAGIAYNTIGTAYNAARINYDAIYGPADNKMTTVNKELKKVEKTFGKTPQKEQKNSNDYKVKRSSDRNETRRSYDPGVDKKSMTYQEKYNEFLDSYTPRKGSPNSLFDIDDKEMVAYYMDDSRFRKEYGVSDTDYKIWKDVMGD